MDDIYGEPPSSEDIAALVALLSLNVERRIRDCARQTIAVNAENDPAQPASVWRAENDACEFCRKLNGQHVTKDAIGHRGCKCGVGVAFDTVKQKATQVKEALRTRKIKQLKKQAGITDLGLTETADKEAFSKALASAAKANTHGAAVDVHTAEELKTWRTFISSDGLCGVAVKPDGDITCVFKHPDSKFKHAVYDLILTAREHGGVKMDCYGIRLVNMYERCGFKPICRIPFNEEYAEGAYLLSQRPDVYAMMIDDRDIETVINDYANGMIIRSDTAKLKELPVFEDYNAGILYRDEILKGSR